jgi:hypothetical protein
MRARSTKSLFWLGTFVGYLQIGALLLGNVVAMGLIVRHVGADVSAAWALLYTIMSAVELTALGLALPLVNGMARCSEEASRWAMLAGLMRTAGYVAICLAGVLLLFEAQFGRALKALFGSVAETVPGLSAALPWCIALSALKSAGYLVTFAFTGMHEVHVTRAYQAVYAVAPAFGVGTLMLVGGGFWSLFVGVQIWQFIALLIVAVHVSSRRPVVRTSGASLPRLSTLGSQAARYGAVLIANQCVLASGGFIVAANAAPGDVLAYVLIWRLAAVMVALINVLPSTLWSRMAAFGDSANERESLLIGRVTLATTVTAAGAALGLAWHAEWLVHLWAGPNHYAGAAVAALLGVYVLGQGVGLAVLNLAFARGLGITVVLGIVAYSILVVMASVALGQLFGSYGVAFAIGTITLIGYSWFAFRLPTQIGFDIGAVYRRAVSAQVLLATGGMLAMYLMQEADRSFAMRMVGGTLVFLSWTLLAWRALPRREREGVHAVLHAFVR